MKKIFITSCLALSIILVGCNVQYFEKAEFGEIVFDPSIAVVFGELNYTVNDLFSELNDASATVGSNDENIVNIVYQEQLQSQTAEDFLRILDQSFATSLPSGVNLANPGVSSVLTVTQSYEFDLGQNGGEAFDSIFFKSGQFDFNLESDFNTTVNFNATIRSLQSSGSPIVINGTVSPSSNTYSQTESLTNYTGYFHLDQAGNASSNKFLVDLSYDIIVSPTSVISSNDRLSFSMGLSQMNFQRVYGFIGSQELTLNFETVSLDFFNQFGNGSISFADPRFSFIFDNSFGFPLGVNFQEIASVTSTGQIIALDGPLLNQSNVITASSLENEGQLETTQIDLTTQNSNIDVLVNSRPRRLVVDVETSTNPAAAPRQYNFLSDESLLTVGVNIEIPLEANIDGLRAEQNLPFTSPEGIDQAKRMMLRLISDNELPLGGLVEIHFLDAQDNIIFTIDERPIFEAAPLGNDGRTSEAVRSSTDILIEEADIQAIKNANNISLIVTLSTTDSDQGTNVKLFNDYELKLTLAAQLDVELNANGN